MNLLGTLIVSADVKQEKMTTGSLKTCNLSLHSNCVFHTVTVSCSQKSLILSQ